MNDSILRFLESMVEEDGTSMEDVLTEVANTATEMKTQENRKTEIDNLLENATQSIVEAIKLIDPDLVPIAEKSISVEILKELIEYMQIVKDLSFSGVLDDFLTD